MGTRSIPVSYRLASKLPPTSAAHLSYIGLDRDAPCLTINGAATDYSRISTPSDPRLEAQAVRGHRADCRIDFERLAARVLEGLGLLRETHRLFISCRRNETSGVAGQLCEALDASGFDVFFDTHGTLL